MAVCPQLGWALWPGNILLVALLLALPQRVWPIVVGAALATFAAYDLHVGLSLRSAVLLQMANAAEILVAAFGLSYSFGGILQLDSLKALAKYSFYAVFLAPLVGVSLGALATQATYWTSWRIDFLSGALGYLTLLPTILALANIRRDWVKRSPVRLLEAFALFSCAMALGYLSLVATSTIVTLVLATVPILIWAALRFGTGGVGGVTLSIAFLAISSAVHGRGHFLTSELGPNIPTLQAFLLFLAAPFMVLAVVVEERKRGRQEILESEKRFQVMADSSPALIWMCNGDGEITYFNDRRTNFTGKHKNFKHQTPCTMFVHPHDVIPLKDAFSRALQERQPFSVEYRLRRHDGVYRWLFDIAAPRMNQDGSFAGFIGSAIDVTDQKLAREALESVRGRLIEAQERERTRIARELHDDICQRLATLSAEIDQAKHLAGESPETTRQRLEKVREGCSGIAGDVQSLSHELHSSKLEYLGISTAIRGFCKEFARQHVVDIDFSEQNVPRFLAKDAALCLFRVAQESLHNARKHSRSRRFRVQLKTVQKEVQLVVEDAGVGFDVEEAKRNPGLGLVSMQERANVLHGRFELESKRGIGTKIVVTIPLVLESEMLTLTLKQDLSPNVADAVNNELASQGPTVLPQRNRTPIIAFGATQRLQSEIA
jgi:PAS domain S-box-containing protein